MTLISALEAVVADTVSHKASNLKLVFLVRDAASAHTVHPFDAFCSVVHLRKVPFVERLHGVISLFADLCLDLEDLGCFFSRG